MMKSLIRNTAIPLAIGALSATLLISCNAMFWYEIPVGGEPRWIVEPANFIKVFPIMLVVTSLLFLLFGPIFYILLRKLQLFTWWASTMTGGLVAFGLVVLFGGEFTARVHPFYFLIGACSALLSYFSHKFFDKLSESSTKIPGGDSQ